MPNAALLVTDSYKHSVNGIAIFSSFFIEDVLLPGYETVLVFETATRSVFLIKAATESVPVVFVDDIFVNAYYSSADLLVRSDTFVELLRDKGVSLSPGVKKIMISHGWPKIQPRFNSYCLYYWLRGVMRKQNITGISFYDELKMISLAEDAFRHLDFRHARLHGMKYSYYDFSKAFINDLKKKHNPDNLCFSGDYVLVIANFEKIKNLWFLVKAALKRKLRNKNVIKTVLLVKSRQTIEYRFFSFCAQKLSISIVSEQQMKYKLLKNCRYLLIPSFSEYNPIVSLEAKAFNKPVVSVFKILALSEMPGYHFLKQ